MHAKKQILRSQNNEVRSIICEQDQDIFSNLPTSVPLSLQSLKGGCNAARAPVQVFVCHVVTVQGENKSCMAKETFDGST